MDLIKRLLPFNGLDVVGHFHSTHLVSEYIPIRTDGFSLTEAKGQQPGQSKYAKRAFRIVLRVIRRLFTKTMLSKFL